MSAQLDLPSSTNGALLVLSLVGFGLSVHLNEPFLSSVFAGVIVITGTVWLFFLSLTIYRNVKALEDAGDFHNDFLSEFLVFYFFVLLASFGVMTISMELWQ